MNSSKGRLSIDLSAIAHNWRYLRSMLVGEANCGAVVKANAYGLGVEKVAPELVRQGCKSFYVADLDEALQLKSLVPEGCDIVVLRGCAAGEESSFIENGFVPVIISVPMLHRWGEHTSGRAQSALKVNTGMGRLGIELSELDTLLRSPESLHKGGVMEVMSHLACADEPLHPLNKRQLDRFTDCLNKLKKILPGVRASLANSAGILAGEKLHFDRVRPGIALYGGMIELAPAEQLMHVVSLSLPVLQVRELPAGESVGYGATYESKSDEVFAVLAGGYADGLHRALSGGGVAFHFNGYSLPVVGRISMDSIVVKLSEMPSKERPVEGDWVEILGDKLSVDDLAKAANTIGYEILTSLGSRYVRSYVGGSE